MTTQRYRRTGPTAVDVSVILGDQPCEVRRIGDWSRDQTDPGAGYPFVSIHVGDRLSVISAEPDNVDQLAHTLAEAADALRTLHHHIDNHHREPPDLFTDQGAA